MRIKLIPNPSRRDYLGETVAQFGLIADNDALFALVDTGDRIELRKQDEPKLGPYTLILRVAQLPTGVSLVVEKGRILLRPLV